MTTAGPELTWTRPISRKLQDVLACGAMYAAYDVRDWKLSVRLVRDGSAVRYLWHARPLAPAAITEAHGTCTRLQEACDAVCRMVEAFLPPPPTLGGAARLRRRLSLALR